MTVLSDSVARVFNRSVANQAVTLGIFKTFSNIWYGRLLHKLKSFGQIFDLILSFLSNRRVEGVLNEKSSQEYPVIAGVPQGSILGSTLFLLYILTFLMMLSVILLSVLMILLSTLTVIRDLICGNNCSWLLNLNLIY